MHLLNLYAQYETTPFEWGKFDCCIWAGRVIDTITDRDTSILDGWKFKYIDKKSALKYLKSKGYKNLKNLADDHFKRIKPNKVMRGDLVLINGLFAINYGDRVVGVGDSGLVKLPPVDIEVSWDIV